MLLLVLARLYCRRPDDDISVGAVLRVNLADGLVAPKHGSPAKTTIERTLVHDQSVFDIVARVAHNCHLSVMPSRELCLINRFHRNRAHEGRLWIYEQVENSVTPVKLVYTDNSD